MRLDSPGVAPQVFRITENLEKEMTAEQSLLASMRKNRELEEESAPAARTGDRLLDGVCSGVSHLTEGM